MSNKCWLTQKSPGSNSEEPIPKRWAALFPNTLGSACYTAGLRASQTVAETGESSGGESQEDSSWWRNTDLVCIQKCGLCTQLFCCFSAGLADLDRIRSHSLWLEVSQVVRGMNSEFWDGAPSHCNFSLVTTVQRLVLDLSSSCSVFCLTTKTQE